MQVILLKNVKKIGAEGATVKVKDGYARNYLIPNKLAVLYTAGAVKLFEAKRKKAEALSKREKERSVELAKKISKLSLTISVESGLEDKLFGSVTSETISHALEQEGVDVGKKNISLAEPIQKLGIYNVEISLHPEVKQTLRIWVVKK